MGPRLLPATPAAIAEAAAGLRASGPVAYCGLATLATFEDVDLLAPQDGEIAVPAGPGLLGP